MVGLPVVGAGASLRLRLILPIKARMPKRTISRFWKPHRSIELELLSLFTRFKHSSCQLFPLAEISIR